MPEFLHGAYGKINAAATKAAVVGKAAMVIVGTAPVGNVHGGAQNVNKPIVLRSMSDVNEYFGYSDNWEKYTLCEAFRRFFDTVGVGPVIAINVLDPAKHKKSSKTTKELTPANGRILIAGAEDIILDSLTVPGKVLNTDYYVAYNTATAVLQISETEPGKLGTAALSISYDEMDPTAVEEIDVIGETDNMGLNTGLYAIANVYQETGYIPGYLLAPGWSAIKSVHDVMKIVSKNIGGHWNAWIIADLPLTDNSNALTLATVSTYKKASGYTAENETVCWPMATLTDGKKYHLSVLRAANHLQLLVENDGVPYHTASNTACADIENLYMGEDNKGRIFSDELLNKYLNAHGITSATYMSGRWVIWGASAADYDVDNNTAINVGETCRMMLYHITNDFQARRFIDVDKPMTVNDILSVAAEEQERLDALTGIGALTYAQVVINAKLHTKSDIMNGDWTFDFEVTNTPLAKSLTARVTWVDNGFVTYIEAFQAAS